MRYIIVSCSPQNEKKSTSAYIANIFRKEIGESYQNQVSFFGLGNKSSWDNCRKAFYESEVAIFVIPVYVENVPGLFLEFLETLERKEEVGKIAFVMQGGFEEASQLRTAEKFVEKIPEKLNCEYGGTLVKGGLFGMASMRGEKFCKKMEREFESIAKKFMLKNEFDEKTKTEFAGREYYSKGMLLLARMTKPLNRLVWNRMAKKMGVKGKLTERPYTII